MSAESRNRWQTKGIDSLGLRADGCSWKESELILIGSVRSFLFEGLDKCVYSVYTVYIECAQFEQTG